MASLNRLAAVYIASNSRSYALYFRCAEFKGLVKKPNGCQVSFARKLQRRSYCKVGRVYSEADGHAGYRMR